MVVPNKVGNAIISDRKWTAVEHIIIDLETMACDPNAAIVAIGAVSCDHDYNINGYFYSPVSLVSAIAAGGVVDGDTVGWWMKQPAEAHEGLDIQHGPDIYYVLQRFVGWLDGCYAVGNKSIRVWGNGADFDNVILSSAFKRSGLDTPWNFWNNQSLRTVTLIDTQLEITCAHYAPRVAHHALYDAEAEAMYLKDVMLGLSKLKAIAGTEYLPIGICQNYGEDDFNDTRNESESKDK